MRSHFSSSGPSRSNRERSRYEGEQQFPEYGRPRQRGSEDYSEQEYGGERQEYQSQSGRYGEESQQGGWGGPESQSFRGGYRQEAFPSSQQGSGQFRSGREGGYEAEDFGRGTGGQERYYGQSSPRPYSPRYEQGGQQDFGGGQGYGRQEFGSSGYGGEFGQYGGQYGGGQSSPGQQGGWSGQSGSSSGQLGSQPYGQRSQGSRTRQGPKNFVRSDERIREAVCERLSEEDSVDISEVSVDVKEGCVTLEGSVPERRMRHTIEDIADSCWGVKDVENRVRVQSQSSQSGSTAGEGSASSESAKGGASLSAKSRGRDEQKDQQSH